MSQQIDFDDRPLRRSLLQLSFFLGDLKPFYEDAGAYVERRTAQRFKDEVAPDGRAWAPLAVATLRAKRNRKILTETGQMRESLSYSADSSGATIGFGDRKARWHQFGTARGLPARPMLGINAADVKELNEIAADQIKQAWR